MIRKMGDFEVIQRIQDGMFNATKLFKQWNSDPLRPKRDLSKFWELENVKDFIGVLMEEENLHTLSEVYVKSKASRGENAGTWVHPILFVKMAMWINPKFEYHVIKFIHDQLIEYRHLAGNNYRGLTDRVIQFKDHDFVKLAKALNYIVFSRHSKGIRQTASSAQLKELAELQEKASFLIEMGYVSNFDELLQSLRKMYRNKHSQFNG